MSLRCDQCDETRVEGRFCSVCGDPLTTIVTSTQPIERVSNPSTRDLHWGLFDAIGEGLRAEIESFMRREQERPISHEYLATLGKVTLDQRKSLLSEARLMFDDPIRQNGEEQRLSFMLIYASFGSLFANAIVKGKLTISSDEYGENISQDYAGNILFLKRGKVPFSVKAKNAQSAGALAVVVMQTFDMWPFVMTDSSSDSASITIPTLMISSQDGELVEKILRERKYLPVSLKFKEIQDECSICQETMNEGETVVKLPGCGHAYHDACVLSWLKKQHTCPLCRNEMPKRDNALALNSSSTMTGYMSTYYN